MADRTIAAAREENGDLSWDDNIESLDWENDEREANQHASYGMKGWLRTAFRFLGPFALGVSRQRAKSAHTTPLMHSMRDRITTNDTAHAIGTDKLVSGKNRCWKRRPWLIAGKSSLVVIILALTVLGFLHLMQSILGGTPLFFGLVERSGNPPDWREIDYIRSIVANNPIEVTRDVRPLPCHSHNDYWRRIPLYEALYYGCESIEADIWLTYDSENPELYVGHSYSSLTPDRTLRNLYINPLLDLINAMNPNHDNTTRATSSPLNGIFQTAPTHPLVLVIDIKNKPNATFAALQAHLEPLRAKSYLTTHNVNALKPGPLTIVTTGSTPYASILAQNASRRDIFFDAPLGDLSLPPSDQSSTYNTTTSYYASASLPRTLGSIFPFSLFPGKPSASELARIRSATEAAHARGLKVRWWETPAWPRGRRERVWKLLMEEGADVLNVDDLSGVRGWWG